ncbi:unnamed protein product [Bursaphelenchus xylophilus]|uniref:(pine wood nematode) hypothetical protein n=1 Tax=Bursaphelenchus xylophilus TaxID=6326 RepID=A0A7I8WY32_BURXY|nr:unnamed protein product [Bursaphelenchus xylophilus]CAG9100977.1 unnamed protein product [Bursaphelenchus xylophilus]
MPEPAPTGSTTTDPAHEEIVLDSDEDSGEESEIDLEASDNDNEEDDCVVVEEHDTSSSKKRDSTANLESNEGEDDQEKDSEESSGSGEDSDFDADSESDDEEEVVVNDYAEGYTDDLGVLCFDINESQEESPEVKEDVEETAQAMEIAEKSVAEAHVVEPSTSSQSSQELPSDAMDNIAEVAEVPEVTDSEAAVPEAEEQMELDLSEQSEASTSSSSSSSESPSDEEEEDPDESDSEPEVLNPFINFKVGAACSELEDQRFLTMYKELKGCYNEWRSDVEDKEKKNNFFDKIHECVMQPSFKRLSKDEKTFEWPRTRRKVDVVDQKDEILCAFCHIQKLLASVCKNPIPHLYQMLMITPNKKDLWIRLAKSSARLSDVKTATFACKRLLFLGEGRRAHERLIVMYYGLCRFPECLLAIKEVFKTWPDNQVALVLLDQMLNSPLVMKDAVEKVMYENQISTRQYYKVEEKVKEKVMRMVQRFRAKIVPEDQGSSLPGAKNFYEVELVEDDLSFSGFSNKLKTIYDEIEEKLSTRISFIYRSPEVFYESDEEEEPVPSPVPTLETNSQPDVEMNSNPSESVADEEESEMDLEEEQHDLEDEEVIQSLMNEMLERLEEEELDVPSVVTIVDAASEESEASAKNMMEVGDENEPPAKKKKKSHIFATRRSTRHVEEIEDCPFSSMPLVLETYNIRKCLKVDKDAEFHFSGSTNTNYYLRMKSPSFSKNNRNLYNELDLRRFFNDLLDEMDKNPANGLFFVSILDRFLSFVATKALENEILFSKEDRNAFCDLYALWKHLRSSISSKKRSRNPFQIHLLAAEFADPLALQTMDFQLGKTVNKAVKTTDSPLPWQFERLEITKEVKELEESDDLPLKLLVSAQRSVVKSKTNLYSNLKYRKWRDKQVMEPKKCEILTPISLKKEFVELGGDESAEFNVNSLGNRAELVSVEPEKTFESDWNGIEKSLAIRYHWTRALQHRFRPVGYKSERKFERKREQFHLLSLFQILDDLQTEGTPQIPAMKSYFNPTTAPVNGDFSLEIATRRFVQNYKIEMDNYIMFLISQKDLKSIGDKDRIIDTIWHYFDWSVLEAADKFDCWRLVFTAFIEKKAVGELFRMAVSGLEDVLQNKLPSHQNALEVLDFFLEQIEQNLEEISRHDPAQLKLLLIELSEKYSFRINLRLWRVIYKVAQLQDPKTTEEMSKFVEETKLVKDRLPLISLMVLKEAHEALGQERRCGTQEGKFLLFCLEEFTSAPENRLITDLLQNENDHTRELRHNLEKEILQLFTCYTGQNIRCRLKLKEHQNEKRPLPPFEILQRILQLILPKNLPLFDDQMTLKSEVMELVRIVTAELESPFTSSHIEEFNEFVAKNFRFKPVFNFESDGTLILPLNSIFEDRDLLAWPRIDMDKDRAIVTSKSLYLSAFYQYRSTGKDIKNLAYQILMMSDALTRELQSSVWIMLAKSSVGSVDDLAKDMDEVLFPFRMSILLKVDCAEAHLDLGSIMYQIHALDSRKMRSNPSESDKLEARKNNLSLIRACQTHFLLADRFKTQAIDIGWLCCYFSGKVSEKLKESIDIVMDHYTECAQRMHDDQYVFLHKISKKNQSNLEPLELFYRVHSFLEKRFFASKEMNGSSLKIRRKILHYMQYYSTYGVSKAPDSTTKQSVQNFFSTLPTTFDAINDIILELTEETPENEIQETMSEMTEWVEIEERTKTLLKSAYESILAKFPHYKAAFRLAEIQINEGSSTKCIKTLMEYVFKGHKRINVNANIFHNITEIQRSDFERGTALHFHIGRCLDLFLKALQRTHDLGHVIVTLHSLSNPAFFASSYLSQDVIHQKIRKCLLLIKNMLIHPRNEWATHFEQYEVVLQSSVTHIAKAEVKVDSALVTKLAELLGKTKNHYKNIRLQTISRPHPIPHRPPHIEDSSASTQDSQSAKAENAQLIMDAMKQLRAVKTPIHMQQQLIRLLERYSQNDPKVFKVLLKQFVEQRTAEKRPFAENDQNKGTKASEPPQKMAKKDVPSTSGLSTLQVNSNLSNSSSPRRVSPKSPAIPRVNGDSAKSKSPANNDSDDIEILGVVPAAKPTSTQNGTQKSSKSTENPAKEPKKSSTSQKDISQLSVESIKQVLISARHAGPETWSSLLKSPMMLGILKLPQAAEIMKSLLAAEGASKSNTASTASQIQQNTSQIQKKSSGNQDTAAKPPNPPTLTQQTSSQPPKQPPAPKIPQLNALNSQNVPKKTPIPTNGNVPQTAKKPQISMKMPQKTAPGAPQTGQEDLTKTPLYEKIKTMSKEQRQQLRLTLNSSNRRTNGISVEQEKQLRKVLTLFDTNVEASRPQPNPPAVTNPSKNTPVTSTSTPIKPTPEISTPTSTKSQAPVTSLKPKATPSNRVPSPKTIQNLQSALLAFQSLGGNAKAPQNSIFKTAAVDKSTGDKEFWEHFRKAKETMAPFMFKAQNPTTAATAQTTSSLKVPAALNATQSQVKTPVLPKENVSSTTSTSAYQLKPTTTHSMANILGTSQSQSQSPISTISQAKKALVTSTSTPTKPNGSTMISSTSSANISTPLSRAANLSTPSTSANKMTSNVRNAQLTPQAMNPNDRAKPSGSKAPTATAAANVSMEEVMKLCVVMQKPMDKWTKEDASLVQNKLPEIQRQFLEATIANNSANNQMMLMMQQMMQGNPNNEKKKAEEEKLKAEKALKLKMEQAEKLRKEQELKKKLEEERKKQMLEEFRKREEERRQRILEEKAAKEAEKRRKIEEEKQRKLAEKQAEQERKAAEKAAELERKRLQAEAERHRRLEEERQRQEERRRQIEAAEKLRAEEERRRIEAEQRRMEAERRQREVEERRKMQEEEARAVESMKSLIDDDQRSNYTDESESFEEERRRQKEEERKRAVEMERLKSLEKKKLIQERIHRENIEKQRQIEENRRLQEQRIQEQRQKEQEDARKRQEMEELERKRQEEHVAMIRRVKSEQIEEFSRHGEYNSSRNMEPNPMQNQEIMANSENQPSSDNDDFLGSFLSEQLKRDEQEREERNKAKTQKKSPAIGQQQSPGNAFYAQQQFVVPQGAAGFSNQPQTASLHLNQHQAATIMNNQPQGPSGFQNQPTFNNQPRSAAGFQNPPNQPRSAAAFNNQPQSASGFQGQLQQTQGISNQPQSASAGHNQHQQIAVISNQPQSAAGFSNQHQAVPQFQNQPQTVAAFNNQHQPGGIVPNQLQNQASAFPQQSQNKVYERRQIRPPSFSSNQPQNQQPQGFQNPMNTSPAGQVQHQQQQNFSLNAERSPLTIPKRSPINPSSAGSSSSVNNVPASPINPQAMNRSMGQYNMGRPPIQRQQAVESPIANSPQFANNSPYQNQRRPSWSNNNSFENQNSPFVPQNPMMMNISNSIAGNSTMSQNPAIQQMQRQMSASQMPNNMMTNFQSPPNSQGSNSSQSATSQPFSSFMRQAVGETAPSFNNGQSIANPNMAFSAGMNMPPGQNMNNQIPSLPNSNMPPNGANWPQGRNNFYQNYYG